MNGHTHAQTHHQHAGLFQGIEDYLGDMDFKFAGTAKGITALQADIKVPGIPLKVAMEAIQEATEAKSAVLGIMGGTLAHPRPEKDSLPVIEKIDVPAHKRSRVMGPGGVHIRRIQADSGVQVSSGKAGGGGAAQGTSACLFVVKGRSVWCLLRCR